MMEILLARNLLIVGVYKEYRKWTFAVTTIDNGDGFSMQKVARGYTR
jgi:hypothetical protein